MTFQPITQSGSPANTDAEEALLACCILDESGDVIARAVELGITPATFSRSQCGSIFGALTRLSGPVDPALLCQQLHTEGQLDFVGGQGEVYRISGRVETSAHARFWMEAVRDAHTARRLSQSAAAIVEAVKAGQPLSEIAVKAEALADLGASVEPGEKKEPRSVAKLLAKAATFRFDLAKPPHEDPWILKLGGVEILHPGNFLAVIAPQKSGKSTTESAMIGSLFGMEGADYLGFTGRNPDGNGVLHVDTEQSARDHYSMMVRTLRRARFTDFPSWFTSLHVRRFSSEERRKIVLGSARKIHSDKGLLAVFIDGVVDLLTDFNDVREATGLINDLMALAEETGCAIICAIHVNPGAFKGKSSDKARGHLGTMLEQKAETIVLLDKQTGPDGDDRITISTKDARHGGVKTPPVFHWCDVAKMHVSLPLGEGFTPVPSLAQSKPDTMATLARDIFDGWQGGAMPYSMIRERAMNAGRCAKSTAERRLNDLLRAGLVSKTDAGLYFLNESGPN